VPTAPYAVFKAENLSYSGIADGILGESHSTMGAGVTGWAYATSGSTYGVFGRCDSPDGRGVYGVTTALSSLGVGVYGQSYSTSGYGVYGFASATTGETMGVYGRSCSPFGLGVYGFADATTGTITYGVYGWSASTAGRGVCGIVTADEGTTYGGRFLSSSTSGTGVYGNGASSDGTNYGVYGKTNSADGYGVYYEGGLTGSGSKSCVVKTSQGPTLLYCQESPENWFEDFGRAQLVDGKAHVELDPLFLETVTVDEDNPLNVFLQPQDPYCRGLAAVPGTTGFGAVELFGGSSNGWFSYRVVAKRKGFEEKRLDYCKAAETDSYLYPELREKELREHEEELTRLEQERLREKLERAQIAEAAQPLR
jgi:hypothetical protein